MRIVLAVCAALAVSGTACGGDDDGPALDELAQDLGQTLCPRIFECCTSAEISQEFEGFQPPIDSIEDCEQLYAGFGGILVRLYQQSVDDGDIIYHPDRMSACLEQLAASDCTEFGMLYSQEFPEACDDPFEGTLALGASCDTDEECESNYCDGDSFGQDGEPVPGECAERPGPGDSCDFDCDAASYCSFDPETGDRVCAARKGPGESCGSHEECANDNCEGLGGTDPGTCAEGYACTGA